VTILAYLAGRPAGHPAARLWQAARARWAVLAGAAEPVRVCRADPVLWVAAWLAGRPVRWSPAAGLGGLAPSVPAAGAPPGADPAAAAVVWPAGAGERVFSHEAVWAAIEDIHALGAAGRGLAGPAGFVQAAAAWLADRPFGWGGRLRPEAEGLYTDGQRRFRAADALLGVFAREEAGAWITGPHTHWDAGRVKSRRLFDGWYRAGGVEPARFEGGYWRYEPDSGPGAAPEAVDGKERGTRTMQAIVASLAGTVFKVLVKPGDSVAPGQEVVRLESMKMEIPVEAEVGGTVQEVLVSEGAFVNEGDPLVMLA
jgi:acetyl-CoA carboxylase biotin carboxyl carrier protein